MKGSFTQLWCMPILLGISTSIGLVSALLGDGIWDIVSAFTLGAPVLAGLWYSLRGPILKKR
jgi:hypothetical protein